MHTQNRNKEKIKYNAHTLANYYYYSGTKLLPENIFVGRVDDFKVKDCVVYI